MKIRKKNPEHLLVSLIWEHRAQNSGEFTGQGPREKAGAQREAGCRNLQRGSRESLARNPSGCVCKETESGERTARNRWDRKWSAHRAGNVLGFCPAAWDLPIHGRLRSVHRRVLPQKWCRISSRLKRLHWANLGTVQKQFQKSIELSWRYITASQQRAQIYLKKKKIQYWTM